MTELEIEERRVNSLKSAGEAFNFIFGLAKNVAPDPMCVYGVQNALARLSEARFWLEGAIDAQAQIERQKAKSQIITPGE